MFPHTTYIYPYGTSGSIPPKDGQVFHVFKNNVVDSTWQYDGFLSQWFKLMPGPAVQQSSCPMDLDNLEFNSPYSDSSYGYEKQKCECGSHSVNSDKHSIWCKLFDPNL